MDKNEHKPRYAASWLLLDAGRGFCWRPCCRRSPCLAPTEATMGNAQRIVYIHVPVAWLGLLGLLLMAGGGVMYLADAESVVGPVVAGGGRTGLALLRPDAGDRFAVGPRRLGNLVDLGPSAHLGLHPVDDLLGLPDPAGAVGRPSSPGAG